MSQAHITKWDCSVVTSDGHPVASLTVTTDGSTVAPFRIKGLCYFEYCDEWWNQSEYSIAANVTCPLVTGPDAPNSGATGGTGFVPPNDYTWYGGLIACGFPNYYWDNDGFGLYSVSVGEGRKPSSPWGNNAPALPLDTRTPRPPVISSFTTFNGLCLISGFVTEIEHNAGTTKVSINSDSNGRPPATGTQGSLSNYFYELGSITAAEEAKLAAANASGEYVTVTIEAGKGNRKVTSVVLGD